MGKIKYIVTSCLFLLSPLASAIEITTCPESNEITRVMSTYISDNQRWHGSAQGAENKGDTVRFLEAFYYPHGTSDRALGILVQCSYQLDAGFLQMKLRDNKSLINNGLYISITDKPAWVKNEENSPYQSYTCRSENAKDCVFSRVSDVSIAAITSDIPVILPNTTATK
ncbi:DUF3757 domain-containing protein [Yersinia vastinensis]|uniref:DUF3757 domain-containing protein n=1 Tax=Yersinia vastinensis TaxID=2890318 RepID=UPI001582FE20|nr:DUF3757 domain-containing protein [Yersinia vastinensis]